MGVNPTLRIEVDDRERNAGLLAGLRAQAGVDVVVRRLEMGDFQVDDAVLFERKTAADFGASLIDGRLFAQASRLATAPRRTAYIVEGSAQAWKALKVPRPALQGALISLMLVFDIPVLRSVDPEETARLLVYAGRQLARARSGGQVPVRSIQAKRRATRQRRILQALPGIGPDRALRLLEHFGSVRACLDADETTLARIDGIGPTTARNIVRTVEEPNRPYGLFTLSDPFLP